MSPREVSAPPLSVPSPCAPALALLGTTASGKGAVAEALARGLEAQGRQVLLISADSMKVYRGMDVGSNKPTPSSRAGLDWRLVDVVDPHEPFTAADFTRLAQAAMAEARACGAVSLVVGGTSLYLMGLLEGFFEGPGRDPALRAELEALAQAHGDGWLHAQLAQVDPVAAARLHPNDRVRVVRALEVFRLTGTPISQLQRQWDQGQARAPLRLVALRREEAEEDQRVDQRVLRMERQGLLDECRRLLDPAVTPLGVSPQAQRGVGYAEAFAHLRGELSWPEAIALIQRNTRHLAKHQRTWLRRIARRHELAWLTIPPHEPAAATAQRVWELACEPRP